MATQPLPLLSVEQYLKLERTAGFRSEFAHGEMLAMAGGSAAHSQIAVDCVRQLSSQLRGRKCQAFNSDMKVFAPVPPKGHVAYPDVVVTCEQPIYRDEAQDVLMNPVLIVEVLSPSTEAYDRGRKFERYGFIQSLQQYLLIAQDRVQADLYTRREDGQWDLQTWISRGDSVALQSIGCTLALAECYERVEFPRE